MDRKPVPANAGIVNGKVSVRRRPLFVVRMSYVVCRQLIIDVISNGENNNQ